MSQSNEQNQTANRTNERENFSASAAAVGAGVDNAKIDARIVYPSYKSFDEFINIERLKSLDDYINEKIKHHITTRAEEYFLNAYRLDADSLHQPGAREIWLSRPALADASAYDYLDKTELWELTEEAENYSLLMDFIGTLPFKATGRMLIIYDDAATHVPAHRDHLDTDICHEFVWFRTNSRKPFYMLNHKTGEKKYVEGYTAWFDAVNQFHGTDAVEGLSFSIRVDGVFSDEFRKLIPTPAFNRASTPAFWASILSQT